MDYTDRSHLGVLFATSTGSCDKGLSKGAIAGIVVGGAAVAALATLAVVLGLLYHKRHRRNRLRMVF